MTKRNIQCQQHWMEDTKEDLEVSDAQKLRFDAYKINDEISYLKDKYDSQIRQTKQKQFELLSKYVQKYVEPFLKDYDCNNYYYSGMENVSKEGKVERRIEVHTRYMGQINLTITPDNFVLEHYNHDKLRRREEVNVDNPQKSLKEIFDRIGNVELLKRQPLTKDDMEWLTGTGAYGQ